MSSVSILNRRSWTQQKFYFNQVGSVSVQLSNKLSEKMVNVLQEEKRTESPDSLSLKVSLKNLLLLN